MNPILVNVVLFQMTWLGFVAGAGQQSWWWGLIPLAILLVWQLPRSAWRKADLQLIGIAVGLGVIFDTAILQAGLVVYSSPFPWRELAPLWMVGLWVGFALTLNHSMRWFAGKPLASVLFGFIGGALAYFIAGRTWHAVTFVGDLWPTLAVIGAGWAVLTPLLVGLAERLRGTAPAAGGGA